MMVDTMVMELLAPLSIMITMAIIILLTMDRITTMVMDMLYGAMATMMSGMFSQVMDMMVMGTNMAVMVDTVVITIKFYDSTVPV